MSALLPLTLAAVTLAAGGLDEAAAYKRVVVVPYQAVGTEPKAALQLATELSVSLQRRELTVLSEERSARAAGLCGEDAVCLSPLGARAQARWVLGFGLGRIGDALLVSAVWVDAAAARQRASASRRVPVSGLVWSRVAEELVAELTRDVTFEPPPPPPVVAPAPVASAPPAVVLPTPAPPPARTDLRPFAWVGVGASAALLISGGVLGLQAKSNFEELGRLPTLERDATARRQYQLNAAADGCVIGAVVAAGAATVLFLLDRRAAPGVGATSGGAGPAVFTW